MSKLIELVISDVFKSLGGFADAKAGIEDISKASEDSSKSIEGMDTSLSETGSKMGETGKKVGAAVGVAVGGALAYGFASSVSFDEAQHKLEASFPKGSAAAKVAGEAAGKLYADGYAGSMEEIGQATKTVIQSGEGMKDATTEQVTHITGEFLSLSKVIGTDVSGSIMAVSALVKNGLVPDMQTGLDLVAAAYTSIGPEAEGLLEAVAGNAQEFERLGLSGPEAMGLVKQSIDRTGTSADSVTTAFKLLVNNMLSGSKTSEQGLRDLGLAHDILGEKTKKASDISHATFTVAASDSEEVRNLLISMGLDIDTISNKTSKSGATTKETFKVSGSAVDELQGKLSDAGIGVDSFTDKMAKIGAAGSGLKVIGIDSDDFRNKIAAGGQVAHDAFVDLTQRLDAVKDPLLQNTIGVELMGKQWKANSEAILAWNPDTAVKGLGDVKGAGDNLNKTLEDTAQNKLTAMKNHFQELMANIVNAPGILGTGGTAFAAFGSSGLGAISSIATVSTALPDGINKAALGVVKAMGTVVTSFVGAAASAVASSAVAAGAWIAANAAMLLATGGVLLVIGLLILAGYEIIKHWGSIKKVAEEVWHAVWGFVKAAVDFIVQLFMNFTLPGIIIGHWNAIVNFTKQAWQVFVNIIHGVVDFVVWLFMNFTLPGIIIGHWNAIVNFTQRAWDAIKHAISSVVDWLVNIGSSMWDGITSGARAMANAVIMIINSMITGINTLIDGINVVNPFHNIPHIPSISHFAAGGTSGGGMALVGEMGPELISLSPGTRVHSNSETRKMLGGGSANGDAQVIQLVVSTSGSSVEEFLAEIIRRYVRVKGGDVQAVFGR